MVWLQFRWTRSTPHRCKKKLRFVFRSFLYAVRVFAVCERALWDAVFSLRSHFAEWDCNMEYNFHIMAYPIPLAQWYFVRLVASVVRLFPVFCVHRSASLLLPLSFSVECNLLRCVWVCVCCSIPRTRCVDINMNAINSQVHTSRQFTSPGCA